jgi:TRAP-type C4-dicarboxylate transport system permease small subunit
VGDRVVALVAGLPGIPGFLALGLPACLALAGAVFALRNLRTMQWLRAGADRALSLAIAALLLAMVFLSALQILLRNVWESGILWIDPLLRHLVLLLAFVGALAATGAKRHVQINVLGRLLRGRWARVGGALVALLGAALCLALARASLDLLAEEIPMSEMAFLGVPTSAVIGVFPLAFVGMGFRMALLALEEAAGMAPAGDTEPIVDVGAAS